MKSREHKLDICFDFTRGTCHRGDGCRFSHNLPPGGVIPPRPKTAGVCFDYTKGICNRGDACRFSHDAQAVAAFAKREEGGPPPPKALPKPLPVPAARPAGSPGAPRRTGAPSKPMPAPATAKHAVGTHGNNAGATRAKHVAVANGHASPWASVAAGEGYAAAARGGDTETPSFRFGATPVETNGGAFESKAQTMPSEGVPNGDAPRAPSLGSSPLQPSRPNFSFGSGTATRTEKNDARGWRSDPFGSLGGGGDFGGGEIGGASSAPRGFGVGGPAVGGGGSPPAFAGGGLGGLFGSPSASLFGNAFGAGAPGGGGAGASPVWGGGGFGGVGGVGGFGGFGGRAGSGSY